GSSDYLILGASDGESDLDLYGGLRGTRLTHRGVWKLAKQNGHSPVLSSGTWDGSIWIEPFRTLLLKEDRYR
ncbi:MAG TPA: hypothetical protein VIW47_01665, partial [Nitrospiraceae bacterium]